MVLSTYTGNYASGVRKEIAQRQQEVKLLLGDRYNAAIAGLHDEQTGRTTELRYLHFQNEHAKRLEIRANTPSPFTGIAAEDPVSENFNAQVMYNRAKVDGANAVAAWNGIVKKHKGPINLALIRALGNKYDEGSNSGPALPEVYSALNVLYTELAKPGSDPVINGALLLTFVESVQPLRVANNRLGRALSGYELMRNGLPPVLINLDNYTKFVDAMETTAGKPERQKGVSFVYDPSRKNEQIAFNPTIFGVNLQRKELLVDSELFENFATVSAKGVLAGLEELLTRP